MSRKTKIEHKDGLYFLTFTCANWIKLFEITNSYDLVYNWFDILKKNGSYICGYVIMPNHIHALIAFKNTENKSIDTIVGNGKRFMAYEIIKRLKEKQEARILEKLGDLVTISDRKKGKLHEVFAPSFDWKECISDEFTETKLNYIHNNPCTGKWNLVKSPIDYVHSSTKYYETGHRGVYEIFNYKDLADVLFIKE
jgi:REP element-mobilizing transposase RayT